MGHFHFFIVLSFYPLSAIRARIKHTFPVSASHHLHFLIHQLGAQRRISGTTKLLASAINFKMFSICARNCQTIIFIEFFFVQLIKVRLNRIGRSVNALVIILENRTTCYYKTTFLVQCFSNRNFVVYNEIDYVDG